jgi:hypothetical protein
MLKLSDTPQAGGLVIQTPEASVTLDSAGAVFDAPPASIRMDGDRVDFNNGEIEVQ